MDLKRIVLLLLSILLLVSCTAQTSVEETKEENVDKIVFDQGGDYGFSIIYNKEFTTGTFEDIMVKKAREYMQKTGLTVELIGVKGMGLYEYNTKLNSKLILEDGPTILLENEYNYGYWVDKPFVNPNRIENYNNLYDCLKSDKFIPLQAYIPTMTMNKALLEEMGVDYQTLNAKSFMEVRREFLKGKKRDMDHMEFRELFNIMIDDVQFVDEDGFLSLTNDSVIGFIEDMKKELLAEHYNTPNFLDYEDVKKFFFYVDKDAEVAAVKRRTDKTKYLMPEVTSMNQLDLRRVCEYNKNPKVVYSANFLKRCPAYFAGMLINPNGRNKENAIDFINDLLSPETQMELLSTRGYAPVIKGLDEEKKVFYERQSIVKESTDVIDKSYELLDQGYYEIYYNNVTIDMSFKDMILKYTYSDHYESIEDIKKELKRVEDKYNFYH